MDKQVAKIIYRCRRCGQEFGKDGVYISEDFKVNGVEVLTGSIYAYHQCEDGVFGVGDLIAGYIREE